MGQPKVIEGTVAEGTRTLVERSANEKMKVEGTVNKKWVLD